MGRAYFCRSVWFGISLRLLQTVQLFRSAFLALPLSAIRKLMLYFFLSSFLLSFSHLTGWVVPERERKSCPHGCNSSYAFSDWKWGWRKETAISKAAHSPLGLLPDLIRNNRPLRGPLNAQLTGRTDDQCQISQWKTERTLFGTADKEAPERKTQTEGFAEDEKKRWRQRQREWRHGHEL